jgi:SAM-dependent methyltransferase
MWDDTVSRQYYDSELRTRLHRPVGEERSNHLDWFIQTCDEEQLSTVIEVGSGAGRDGVRLQGGGLTYTGVDLSEVGVAICREHGLDTVAAPATALPFDDNSFDAGWTMSTLMHLPTDEFTTALGELHRVLRPGGLLAVGLWGSTYPETRVDDHGRLFQRQTDGQIRIALSALGWLIEFDTWDWFDDGGHYQWSAIKIC